jgi:hypothetical protein
MRVMLAKIHAHPRKNVKETGLCAKKANMPVMGLYKKARRVRVGCGGSGFLDSGIS